MKTRLYISILFCIVAVNAWAQTFNNTHTPSNPQEYGAIQSQQIMSANTYNETVYEPFSSAAPSEQSVVGAEQAARANGPKKFPKPGETGQSDEYPLGDAALPLLLMSLAFAGVIYFRKRQARA